MGASMADSNGMTRVLASIPEGDLAPRDEYRTKLGIVFRIRPVPPLLLQDARKRIPEPAPPRIHIEDKDTWEENLSDPDYLHAMQEYENLTAESANGLMLTRGTEPVRIPDGIDKPDDSGWAEDVTDFTGLEIPAVGTRRRYYCWMKYVAVATQQDFLGILRAVSRMSGLTGEADVADAIERFPDNPPRDTVAEPPLAAHA